MKDLLRLVIVSIVVVSVFSIVSVVLVNHKKDTKQSVVINDTAEAGPFNSLSGINAPVSDEFHSYKEYKEFINKLAAANETESETEEDSDRIVDDVEAAKETMLDRMSHDSVLLAKFLLQMGELGDFTGTYSTSWSDRIMEAAYLFNTNEELRQQALARAKEITEEATVTLVTPYEWAEEQAEETELETETEGKSTRTLRIAKNLYTVEECRGVLFRLDVPPIPPAPLATIAATGEPISSKPGGPWAGPAD